MSCQGRQPGRSIELRGHAVISGYRAELYELMPPAYQAIPELLQNGPAGEGEHPALWAFARDMATKVRAIQDPILARLARMQWAHFSGQFGARGMVPADDIRWVLEALSPNDRLWVFHGSRISSLFYRYLEDPEFADYLARMEREHSNPDVQAGILHLRLIRADEAGDDEALRRLYGELAERHGSTYPALWVRRYDPNRPLQMGRRMPAWALRDLEGERFSSQRLEGRPYFLEVWATWCGPCVGEMPSLHAAAYEGMGARTCCRP